MSTNAQTTHDPAAATLAALIREIDTLDQTPTAIRRRFKSQIRLVGRGFAASTATPLEQVLGEIPADPRFLQDATQKLPYSGLGVSRGYWRSAVRETIRLARATKRRKRADGPHLAEWEALLAATPVENRLVALRAFLRVAMTWEIAPDRMTDVEIERYRRHLEEHRPRAKATAHIRTVTKTWNEQVERQSVWPQVRLTVPVRKPVYRIDLGVFPDDLRQDLAKLLKARMPMTQARLSTSAVLSGASELPRLKASSHRKFEDHLLNFLGTLVRIGTAPQSVTSLREAFAIENVVKVIEAMQQRTGKETGSGMMNMLRSIRFVLRHVVKAPDDQVRVITRLLNAVKHDYSELTPKNRTMLRQFKDKETLKRIHLLPLTLMRRAERSANSKIGALAAQMATAIEILLMAPIRAGNLAMLDLARHMSFRDSAAGEVCVIQFGAEETKQGRALTLELPPESTSLVRTYIRRFRPLLDRSGSTALFPANRGASPHKSRLTLSKQISQCVYRETGARIHAHGFRHLAAMVYLEDRPEQIELVAQVLGHNSTRMLRTHYAEWQNETAFRRFDEVILARRNSPIAAGA
ncbi:MAG: tyrosine-type recombinase/integrase [Magnetospirillum sp.]|nr:tyrosine-type recombinase/integrase [Magnetospirillum sp.]